MDQVHGHVAPTKVLHFGSMCGQLTFRYIANYNGTGIVTNWIPETETVAAINLRRAGLAAKDDLRVYRYKSRYNFGQERGGFYAPHWTIALLCGTFATIPIATHLKWRFSLRTLLIATTLVAVLLGIIMWTVR